MGELMRGLRRFLYQRDLTDIVRFHLYAVTRSSNDRSFPDRPPIKSLVVVREMCLPLMIGCLSAVWGLSISAQLAASLVVVTGVLAAFFFQVSIQVLVRAASWVMSVEERSDDGYEYARLLHDLAASSSYAALISVSCALAAVGAGISSCGWNERLFVGMSLGLISHLLLTLVLVLVRVFLLTRGRILRVVT